MSNCIPDGCIVVERNGITFLAHWKYRFDPTTLLLGAAAVGTVVEVASTLEQGKQAEALAEDRADIDLRNAEAVRESSVELAKIRGEQGRRLLATQKSRAAAGGVRINVGSSLVLEAETRAAIARDIGLGLKRGRVESETFRSSADIERRTGKAIRKRSKFDAISKSLTGFGSIANMGIEAGLFGKKKFNTSSNLRGTFES